MSNYKLDYFYVKNYRSIYDELVLDLTGNTPVTAFYGPNASGKTNIFRALTVFCNFIKRSTDPDLPGTPYDPFLLRVSSNTEPSEFRIVFHDDINKYQYSFTILRDKIIEEEMYDLTSSRPRTIFIRSKGSTDSATRNGFGKNMFDGPGSVRDDSLLITLAQQTKNQYANAVFGLIYSISTFTLTETNTLLKRAADLLQKNPDFTKLAIQLLREADFSIVDFTYSISNITPDMLSDTPFSDDMKERLIEIGRNVSFNTAHDVKDKRGDKASTAVFDMNRQESLGTKIYLGFIIIILNTINKGKTLYIDEFGASLHTNICQFIIKLFQTRGPETGAKLIVNTHDIGLLKNGLTGVLDKNDVIIVEKDRFNQTRIKPLAKIARSDDNLGKKYTLGIYGGIPIIEEVN